MEKAMKATGIVRKVDELGRVVIPAELRQTMDINDKDAMEIYTDGECIVLKKYSPGCTFCGGLDDMMTFRGKLACSGCIAEIGMRAKISMYAKPVL